MVSIQIGDRVCHREHGFGTIARKSGVSQGLVYWTILFDIGKESSYQSAQFKKVPHTGEIIIYEPHGPLPEYECTGYKKLWGEFYLLTTRGVLNVYTDNWRFPDEGNEDESE